MVFKLTLVIRKTIYKSGWHHPKVELLATVKFHGPHHSDPRGFIDAIPGKGVGTNANIERTEQSFVKYLFFTFGTGKYSVLAHKGKYASFWNGEIDSDRFIRYKGNIAPYLKTEQPRVWHHIKFTPQQMAKVMIKRRAEMEAE